MQIQLTTHDLICITLTGTLCLSVSYSFCRHHLLFFGGGGFPALPQEPVLAEEHRDVKRLTVFVLPKKLQLLLLLSAQGVDDGDGQAQSLSRVAVWSQGVHPGAGCGHVFWGDTQQTLQNVSERQPKILHRRMTWPCLINDKLLWGRNTLRTEPHHTALLLINVIFCTVLCDT